MATADNLMENEPSPPKGMRNGVEQWLAPAVYDIGKVMHEVPPVDTLHREGHAQDEDRSSPDSHHQRVDRRCAQQGDWLRLSGLPVSPRTCCTFSIGTPNNMFVVPMLGHTSYSLKKRAASNWHPDEIVKVMAIHQEGNMGVDLFT